MDSGYLQQERVRQLERELDSLRAYVEEKENAVVKAAEISRALLRENETLEERLSEVNKESTQRIEELEQARFSALQKLECQKSAIVTVQQDMDSLRTELKKEYEMREDHLKQSHSRKIHEVELLCSDLRGENERLEAQCKAGREKIAALETRLREATEHLESASTLSSPQPEFRKLEQMCMQERNEKEELQSQLSDAREGCGLLGMELEEMRVKVERLTEECQERSDQANEWYKALQESKEQVMGLNAQLEALRMEMGNNHQRTGNSLFGEVDDRRLEVERKYVSLQVKHESLDRRHTAMSQQYKRLKAEMSSLLCQFSVVGADAAHIRRLEVALRQAQTEKETLLTKLHKLEKQQASVLASQERLQYVAAFGDKKEYIALIELQLNRARKENAILTKDLEMKGLQLVWETQKLRETEGRLHRKEQEMARSQKEMSTLKMKLHETQENMEKADSHCKQQEAQVSLLERELQLQRCRDPHQRGSQASRHDSSSTTNTGLSVHQHTVAISSKNSSEKQLINSLEDELSGGDRECREKENIRVHTQSLRKEESCQFNSAPVSFLEDIEKELEKQSSTNETVRGGHTDLKRNVPKATHKQRMGPPVHPIATRTIAADTKVNQCPQQ